jgi:hypothetical protein
MSDSLRYTPKPPLVPAYQFLESDCVSAFGCCDQRYVDASCLVASRQGEDVLLVCFICELKRHWLAPFAGFGGRSKATPNLVSPF